MKRRPTTVRVLVPEEYERARATERTPLIKPGVTPDLRKTVDDVDLSTNLIKRAEIGLGRMVELGLPLIL